MQRTGDRDALLLAAGELRGAVGAAVGEPDLPDDLVDPGLVRPCRRRGSSGSVMFSSAESIGRRLKNWKMKPMWFAAEQRQVLIAELRDVRSVDRDRARGRAVEPGEDVHQGRLARARRAHDGSELAAWDVEVTPRSASTAVSPSP